MNSIETAKNFTAQNILNNLVNAWNDAIADHSDADEAGNHAAARKADARAQAVLKATQIAYGLSEDDAMDFLNGF